MDEAARRSRRRGFGPPASRCAARRTADAIQQRHGSRRSGLKTPRSGVSRRRSTGRSLSNTQQLSLDLG